MYLQFIEQCLTKNGGSKSYFSECTMDSILLNRTAQITRRSIVIENLQIVADDPVCTFGIVNKIFNEVAIQVRKSHELPSQEDDPRADESNNSNSSDSSDNKLKDKFYFYEVACALATGNLDQRRMT